MTITCIISCAGYEKNIPVLTTCIRSLLKARTKETKLILMVTTNNSQHVIKNSHINSIIVSPKKAGFVGINNKAVKQSITKKSDYYLIINDDAWVNKNFFSSLETEYNTSKKGDVIVPLVYEANKKTLDSFGVEYFRTGYPKNTSHQNIPSSLASMSCLLIKTDFLKKMVRQYGFFLNPILVWYLDDVEFSIRALASGGTIYKCNKIIAYHQRTFTWGRKSYFVIYHSFRNQLWVMLLTWPLAIFRRNLLRVLLWQIMTACYCLLKYTPLLYPKILFSTIINWKSLMRSRKKIIKNYTHIHVFNTMFSSLEIRHDRLTF